MSFGRRRHRWWWLEGLRFLSYLHRTSHLRFLSSSSSWWQSRCRIPRCAEDKTVSASLATFGAFTIVWANPSCSVSKASWQSSHSRQQCSYMPPCSELNAWSNTISRQKEHRVVRLNRWGVKFQHRHLLSRRNQYSGPIFVRLSGTGIDGPNMVANICCGHCMDWWEGSFPQVELGLFGWVIRLRWTILGLSCVRHRRMERLPGIWSGLLVVTPLTLLLMVGYLVMVQLLAIDLLLWFTRQLCMYCRDDLHVRYLVKGPSWSWRYCDELIRLTSFVWSVWNCFVFSSSRIRPRRTLVRMSGCSSHFAVSPKCAPK